MASRLERAPRRAAPRVDRIAFPRLRAPAQRSVALALALVAGAALAYLAARESSLFAVREFAIEGGSDAVRRDARAALAELEGESLVAIDAGALAERLEALPTVRSAHVDRAFPDTLSVAVVDERPLAVLRGRGVALLVSARGRVIRRVKTRALPGFPRVWTSGLTGVDPGEAVKRDDVEDALAALSVVPDRFPARVFAARAGERGVVLVLGDGAELRLGDGRRLGAKLAAADAVLRALSPEERRAVVYVDATLPNRVVVSNHPQVESEG